MDTRGARLACEADRSETWWGEAGRFAAMTNSKYADSKCDCRHLRRAGHPIISMP